MKIRTAFKLVIAIYAIVALYGCTSIQEKKQDESSRLHQASLLIQDNFKLFYIPSNGFIEDSIFLAASKTIGPSERAKNLANLLVSSEKTGQYQNRQINIVITGPSDAKTSTVINDAIKLVRDVRFSNITIMYLGNVIYNDDLETLIQGANIEYRFGEF